MVEQSSKINFPTLVLCFLLFFACDIQKRDSSPKIKQGRAAAQTERKIKNGDRIKAKEEVVENKYELGEALEEIVLFDLESGEKDIPKESEVPVKIITPIIPPTPQRTHTVEEQLPSMLKIIPKEEIQKATLKVDKVLNTINSKKDFSKELRQIELLGYAACPRLAQTFGDKKVDWKKRWVAAMGLARLRTNESKKALLKGLKGELSVIRMASLTALKNYPSSDVVDRIHEVFLTDGAMLVRNTAVDVLSKIRDPRSISVLASGLNTKGNFYKGKSFWIRNSIVKALGNTKMKEAVPHLINVLIAKDPSLYEDTLRSLNYIVSANLPFELRGPGNTEKKVEWWLAWWQAHKGQYL